MYKTKFIYFFFLFILILSSTVNSHISYFYSDNIFMRYIHEVSLEKKLFEVLLQKYSINGIPVIPISPNLNFLSYFNYQIGSDIQYILYLLIFRFFEFAVILIIINSFFKDQIPLHIKIFVFSSLIFYFNIFDHQSYINFPIIIFNLGIAVAYRFKEKKFFYLTIFFFGNLWSFLINPIYFITTCFIPLLFYYFYLYLNKEFKLLLITFFINLPFSIIYVLITLGTARFFFGNEIINETSGIYNFSFLNSYIISILILILVIGFFFNKKILNQFTKSFIFIQILFLILGLIFKFNIINWFLPHPVYLEYSFQYIFISSIIFVIHKSENIVKKILFFFIFVIIFYQVFNNFSKFLNHNKLILESKYLGETKLLKRHFWQDNQLIFLNDKYSKNIFFINMPHHSSDFVKYLLDGSSGAMLGETMMMYNNNFKHSLTWNEFFRSSVVVNVGHSLLLNTSTLAANLINFNENKTKNVVPIDALESKLNNIYDIDYVLSDIKLNLELKEILSFNNFELYIYKYPKSISKKFDNIIYINDYKDFYFNKNKMLNNFYIKNNLKNIKIPLEKCDLTRNADKKYLEFLINSSKFPCLAIFPITYSNTNEFRDTKNNEFKTFRGQYFFHSYVFNEKTNISIRKNSILIYAYNSFLDFRENRIIFSNYKYSN